MTFFHLYLMCIGLKTEFIPQLHNECGNSYFLHWNFDWKSCFVVFFLEWNEWKNPQFNFSSQNLSIERNFFKWDGKETKILHLLFHRIWKNFLFVLHHNGKKIFINSKLKNFSKFYGKVGVISWFLFHLIWKKLCSILRFWLEKLNCGFFTCFTHEQTLQNNFSRQV